jgi:hypothetical protein
VGRLEGKIALITGGHSGIGRATARQFVNEGAYVFITGRRKAELAAAVKEIGRNASGVQGDVSNLADLDRLFAQIKKEKGKLDIVFANAGSSGTAFCTVNCPTAPQSSSMRRGEQGTGPYSVYSATKAAVVRSNLDHGSQGSAHSRERDKPWLDRYSCGHGFAGVLRSRRAAQADDSHGGSARQIRHPMRSPRPSCSSRPKTAATSPERNCLWMVASLRCKPDFGAHSIRNAKRRQ